MKIVREKIFESPDCICMFPLDGSLPTDPPKPYDSVEGIYVNKGWECKDDDGEGDPGNVATFARYFHKEARPFGIINVDTYGWDSKPMERGKFWAGNPGEIHEIGRHRYLYAGRLWLEKRIISFWEYPPQNKLQEVLDALKIALEEKHVNSNLLNFNDLWIEIIVEGAGTPTEENKDNIWNGDVHTRYIKVSEYRKLDKVIQPNAAQLGQEHIKSPLLKQKHPGTSYGGGSKLTSWDSKRNIKQRQAERTSESLVPESLDEAMVGHTPIADVEKYISGMAKGANDKTDFLSKIDVDCILDFGCADGYILNTIDKQYPNIKGLIGYDIDDNMINMIKSKYPHIKATDNWKEAVYWAGEYDKVALSLMSVIHEVYTYGSPQAIHQFWKQQVFNPEFEYVVIRDMMPALEYGQMKPSDEDIEKIKNKLWKHKKYRKSFEEHWGEITNDMRTMLHWLLKYDYKSNWGREVKENYFPVSLETVKSKIPQGWKIIYEDHYIFEPIANKVKRDFGIELKHPTHVKMIIKNENSKR